MRALTPKEAANELSVSEKHLRFLTDEGHIRYINIGLGEKRERRRYDPIDLEQFLEARKCLSSSAPDTKPIAMTSAIVVHDFQARRTARQNAKPSATKTQSAQRSRRK